MLDCIQRRRERVGERGIERESNAQMSTSQCRRRRRRRACRLALGQRNRVRQQQQAVRE